MKGKVLVTGGAGYIGSHTAVQLLKEGYSVVILDNLSNSNPRVLDRIQMLAGRFDFVECDIRDRTALRKIFQNHLIGAVIHFAGLKAVGQSEAEPLKYYDNNVAGSLSLLEEMMVAGVNTMIFSSSATVYGNPGYPRYREDTPLAPVNVYGRTKLMVEDVLRDLRKAQPKWRIALLRYFNPVGAHESGQLGEDPVGVPNNLMPFIAQVAIGKRPKLLVYGANYPTPDGTGLRDYIHVDDLAAGHLTALKALHSESSLLTVNLGTGRPYSVLEMIKAFEAASGTTVPYEIVEPRPGDLAEYYADPTNAKALLHWEAKFDINRMCMDTWRWQQSNPNGFE